MKPEVASELADLGDQGIELRGKARLGRGVIGLLSLADQRLRRLHQLGDRRDAVVGGLNRVDAVGHGVQQAAQGVGAVVEALRGEEADGVVEGRIDLVAGRQSVLGLGDQIRSLLQLQQVRTNTCGENDVRHLKVPFW